MKKKRITKKETGNVVYDDSPPGPMIMKDAAVAYSVEEAMVRTQIYLSRAEHEFVQKEAARQNVPMAAIIRQYIDDNMEAPDNAWTNNPMLAPSAEDSTWEGHEDASINHDHYIYGTPKRFMKSNGKWVETALAEEEDGAARTQTSKNK